MANLDEWLDAFEEFSDAEVEAKVRDAESKAQGLQAQLDALHTRAASLRVLLDARRKLHDSRVTPGRSEAARPTVGDVVHRRSPNGTSQAILNVMRTDPHGDWPIGRILEELAARGHLPSSKDPRRAVDATLHRLTNVTEEVKRPQRGVYRLSPSPLNEEIPPPDG
jgi:hypothetical protein